jgi:hypothetical protein
MKNSRRRRKPKLPERRRLSSKPKLLNSGKSITLSLLQRLTVKRRLMVSMDKLEKSGPTKKWLKLINKQPSTS